VCGSLARQIRIERLRPQSETVVERGRRDMRRMVELWQEGKGKGRAC
jgi:hypothetical protein